MHPLVTTHMRTAREMEMEGLRHPSAAVRENTRPNRLGASVMRSITFENR